MTKRYIGIDLGGTNIAAGLVEAFGDGEYKIIAEAKCKTELSGGYAKICEDMAEVAKNAAKNAGISLKDVEYVGIGAPGLVNQDTGVVEYANNLGFRDAPIRAEMEKLCGVKVFIDNDANAAAIGEHRAGAGRGAKNMIAITLGTGVGSGVIIDNKIYSGFNFAASELGHMIIKMDGESCTCGINGCFEAYASATALIQQTKAAMQSNSSSKMWEIVGGDIEKTDGRTAFDALRAGDAAGIAVVKKYAEYLSFGLVNVINIFQPEILCIGGGICKEGDTLLNPVRETVNKLQYARFSNRLTKIVPAALGNDAGVIGAALQGIKLK